MVFGGLFYGSFWCHTSFVPNFYVGFYVGGVLWSLRGHGLQQRIKMEIFVMLGFDQILPDLVKTWTVWCCDHAGCNVVGGVGRNLVFLAKSYDLIFVFVCTIVYVGWRCFWRNGMV